MWENHGPYTSGAMVGALHRAVSEPFWQVATCLASCPGSEGSSQTSFHARLSYFRHLGVTVVALRGPKCDSKGVRRSLLSIA